MSIDIYNEIQLDFSRENVRKVVEWGANPDCSPHSHQAIVSWCERFWNKYCDVDAPKEIEEIMPLLAEIETEWDIYLADYYQQHPDSVTVSPSFPSEYFGSWLVRVSA